MSGVSLLKSQWSSDSSFLPSLLPTPIALSVLSFSQLMANSSDFFFRKFFQYFSSRKWVFFLFFFVRLLFSSWEKLIGWWCVKHAAIRHWYSLLCIYTYITLKKRVFVHSFFTLLKNLILIYQTEGSKK